MAFEPWEVTSRLTLSQEYKQRKRYSFTTRLLQICANVKSARSRRSGQERKCKCPPWNTNPFIFNMVQGYGISNPASCPAKRTRRCPRGVAVSTAFSTEDRAWNLKEKSPKRSRK